MIGIGVAVDYSLFILVRYREEIRAGRTHDAAGAAALATSGRAVVFSGLTVLISVAALFLVPSTGVRSMAVGAIVVVAVSVLAAVTLRPVVDRCVQPDFVQTWAPQLAVMPTLRIGAPAAPAGPPAGTSPEGIMACRATLIEFLSAIDHGRATDALDLFTDDASFAARGQQLQGRPAIAGFLQERQAEASRHTVHVLSNEIVRSATADRLELTATLLLHEREPDGNYAIHRALNTTQSFHRHHDRWRIHTRSTQPIHPPPT